MEYTELIWDRYLDSFDSELTELWDLMGSSLLRSAPSARVAILKKNYSELFVFQPVHAHADTSIAGRCGRL